MNPPPDEKYLFDGVVADPRLLSLERQGVLLELEPKAVRVLFYLIQNRNRVVTKDELIAEVWEGAFVSDNSLTRVVAQIRKQLGDNARAPRYIETSSTVGYRFIADVSVATPDTRNPPSPVARKQRHLLLLACGMLVLLLAGFAVFDRYIAGRVEVSGLRQVTNSDGADFWPTFSPDASQLAFSSNRRGTFEIYVRSLAPGGTERQITTDRQESIQPDWSPDGQYLAYVPRLRGGIAIIPVSGGAPRYLTDSGDSPSWSPDGKTIAYRRYSMNLNPALETTGVAGSTIWLLPLDGSAPRALTQAGTPPGGHGSPRWTPDGKRILFSSSAGSTVPAEAHAWLLDLASGSLEALPVNSGSIWSPILSHSGQWMFFLNAMSKDPGLLAARLTGFWRQTPQMLIPAGLTKPRHLNASADGKHLAFSQQIGESVIWTLPMSPNGLPDGTPHPLIPNRNFRNTEPVFSWDGQKLAYASVWQGGEYSIVVANADGSAAVAATAPELFASKPSWVGRELTIGFLGMNRNEIGYWLQPLTASPRRMDLKMDLRRASRVRLSPDGTKLAAHFLTTNGNYIAVEDLKTHSTRRISQQGVSVGFPCWSPDGKWIAAERMENGESFAVYYPADGGQMTELATGTGQAFVYDWAPDSDKITFAGLHHDVWNIYWVSRRSGHVEKLTEFHSNSAFVRYPAWSPRNDQIVFEHNDLKANIYVADVK